MVRKHAIVTGASRGIGRAIATKLAAGGYDLTITCINNEDKLNELAGELRKNYGITCKTFTGDLSDPGNVNMLYEGMTDLSVLVNNAVYPMWASSRI